MRTVATTLAEIKRFLDEPGAKMYVCYGEDAPLRVLGCDFVESTGMLLIPITHDGKIWIERLGPKPNERLSSLIKVVFMWNCDITIQ